MHNDLSWPGPPEARLLVGQSELLKEPKQEIQTIAGSLWLDRDKREIKWKHFMLIMGLCGKDREDSGICLPSHQCWGWPALLVTMETTLSTTVASASTNPVPLPYLRGFLFSLPSHFQLNMRHPQLDVTQTCQTRHVNAEFTVSAQMPLCFMQRSGWSPRDSVPISRQHLRHTSAHLSFIINWPPMQTLGGLPPCSPIRPSEETLPPLSLFLNKMKGWQSRGTPRGGGQQNPLRLTLILDISAGASL